ncbi:MAG: ECF-type sigma factor [Phycisphaerales bacterium]
MSAPHASSDSATRPQSVAELYHVLVSGERVAVERAIAEIFKQLTAWASHELRRRGLRGADFQSDSLAGSAMRDGPQSLVERAKDAQHFEALLRTRLHGKIIDRVRKGGRNGRVRAFGDLAENAILDPAAPHSEDDVDLHEHEEEVGFERLRRVLLSPGGLSEEHWRLVEDHLVRQRSLGEIAGELGINRDAAKQRFATARRRAARAVFRDIEPRLSPETRAIASDAFTKRDDATTIAARHGLTEAEVLFVSLDVLVPLLMSRYGLTGTRVLTGLLSRQAERDA